VDTKAALDLTAVVYPLMVCAYLSSFLLYSHFNLKELYNKFTLASLFMYSSFFLLAAK